MNNKEKWYKVKFVDDANKKWIGWVPAEISGQQIASLVNGKITFNRDVPMDFQQIRTAYAYHFLLSARLMFEAIPETNLTYIKTWEGMPLITFDELQSYKGPSLIPDWIIGKLKERGFNEEDIMIKTLETPGPMNYRECPEIKNFFVIIQYFSEIVGQGPIYYCFYLSKARMKELGYYENGTDNGQVIKQNMIPVGAAFVIVAAVVVGFYLLSNKK